MKAVGYNAPGSIDREDALVDLELPLPALGPYDLLVEVKAVSVNPVDYKLRASMVPEEGQAKVLGFDAAGVVVEVGDQVTLFSPGDEVFYAGDWRRPGSNSQFHAIDARLVGRKPRSLTWAESAAMPLTSLTAWELLFDRLRVPYGVKSHGETLLIINGAGGVGSILIQLAKRLTGLRVVATASRPQSAAWAREMGADHVIDHHKGLKQGLAEVGIDQVAYIAGLTATGKHLAGIVECIAPQGSFALIDDPEVLDIVPFKRKSVSVSWEFMFTRSLYQTPDMMRQHHILNEVSALLDAGLLRTTLTQTLSPINAQTLKVAHALVESGTGIGKIVVCDAPD
ncbi:MAG: zinc-binding alcohol dehydrogenase family protein [Candidatus Puniceispirillum sp.]|nr:zinc-binding alcohol dehydrogenase family protein [Candidatus Puniceispirillum sp.]